MRLEHRQMSFILSSTILWTSKWLKLKTISHQRHRLEIPIRPFYLVAIFPRCIVSNLRVAPFIHVIMGAFVLIISLQWRHNDHDSVSNHQPHGCLLKRLFRRRSKKTSKLRVTGLCVGNSPGPVNSPHKGPVTRKMFPFDDVIMFHKISRREQSSSFQDEALTACESFTSPSSQIFHLLLSLIAKVLGSISIWH